MKETNLYDPNKLPPSLARAALTDADWRFLRVVHLGGGYVLRRQATLLGLGRSAITTYRRLQDLVRLGFLTTAHEAALPRGTHFYKLTARALAHLDDRDSHIRRRHTERTILYKLLRLQFVAEQTHAGRLQIALDPPTQQQYFLTQGFAIEVVPPLEAARSAVVGVDAEHLYLFPIDRKHQRARTQLLAWLDTYAAALASGGPTLRLIVVVPDAIRERVYRRVITKQARAHTATLGVLRVAWWPFQIR